MSQNRGTFQYGITFDTSSAKKSLQELNTLMNKLSKMSVGDFKQISGEINTDKAQKELIEIQQTLNKVKVAYSTAFNQKLGIINMQTFDKELDKVGLDLNKLNKEFSKLGVEGQNAFAKMHAGSVKLSSAFRESSSLLDKMGRTLANTIKWNISSSIVNSFSGKIQEAYGYVKHLDSSLNDIRIVTGKSADEMNRFAQTANKAAQQLGKTTTDYTEASLIYYQQGLSDSDVKNMTDLTLKASNVTGEATAQVSEYFTALKNGYQIATEDMESQVDKMAAVAATTASDLGELSTAVSRVASTAAASGVGLDSLIAQISTIESVTRQAPESIGTALKTIYARLGDLKVDGSIIDEDGFEVKLGEVSGQLQQMGVNILDVNGNMRDQQEVIEEIGVKWQNWTKEQKEAAAIAMAGKRQYNNLFALFENFDQYNKAMETSASSLGTLQKQQETYEDSTSYHLNKLTTQWEDLYDSMLDAHTINTVSDLFTGLLKGVTALVDGLGGGINTLTTFIGLFAQLGSKSIVNVFAKPLLEAKQAREFSEQAKGQVQTNVAKWKESGNVDDRTIEAQQQYAEKASSHFGRFTREDADAYNAIIDRIGDAGAALNETDETIKIAKNNLDNFGESLNQIFLEAPEGFDELNDEFQAIIDKEKDVDKQTQQLKDTLKKDFINKAKSSGSDVVDEVGKNIYDRAIKQGKSEEVAGRLADEAMLKQFLAENTKLKEIYEKQLALIEQQEQSYQDLNNLSAQREVQEKEFKDAMNQGDSDIELLENQKKIEEITKGIGALISLGSGIGSLTNAFDTLGEAIDGTKDPLDACLEAFTSLVTTGLSVWESVRSLKEAMQALSAATAAESTVAAGSEVVHKGLNAQLITGAAAAKKFWVAILAPVASALAALAAIWWATKRIKGALDEGKPSAEDLEEKFNELKNKAAEAESALKQTTDRLKEIDQYLSNPDKYEITDPEDLERLKAEKEELLAIKEAQEIEARSTAVEAANASYTKLKEEKPNEEKISSHIYDKELGMKLSIDFDNIDEVKAEIEKTEKEFNEYREKNPNSNTSNDVYMERMAQVLAENRAILQTTENSKEYWAKEILRYSEVKKEFDNAISQGGKIDEAAYKDVSEHLKNAKEHMEKLSNDSEKLSFNAKETAKFTGDKEEMYKAASSTQGQFASYSGGEGFTFTPENFKDTDFGKAIAQYTQEELSDLLGESLADKVFGLSNGTITNLQTANDIIHEATTQIAMSKGFEDGILSPKEIQEANITLDDYDSKLIELNKILKDTAEGTEEHTKALKELEVLNNSYNDILANTIKGLGVSNEEFLAMQQSILKDNQALKELSVGDKAVQKLAVDAIKMQKGFDGAYDSIKSLRDMAQKGIDIKADPEALTVIEHIKTNLANAFELPTDVFDTDFIAENYEEISKALEEGGEAVDKLRAKIANSDDFVVKLGVTDKQAISDMQSFISDGTELMANSNFEAGATIDDSKFLATLQEMITSGKYTAQQIQSALSAIGMDIDIEELDKGEATLVNLQNNIEDIGNSTQGGAQTAINEMKKIEGQVKARLTGLRITAKPKGSVSSSKKSPSGGGGGGSSKGSTPKNTDLSINKIDAKEQDEWKKDEIDRYHEVDTSIQMMDNSLERYGKISEKVFGTNLLSNYSKEISTLNDKVGELSKKWEIASDHQGEMVDKLNAKGFKFNEDGTIENYKQNLEDLENKVEEEVKKYNKSIEEYNNKAKDFNTQAYKKEEQNENLKFTEKEETRYKELDAKIKKAKKEAEKKGTYDKLSKEEKKYIGLNDKEKKELKALEKKFAKQQKLQKDFDRWEYLREKKANANLSKKEKKELKDYETKYKNLAGVAAKLAKEEEKLDKAKEKLDNMKQDYTDTIALADEYDQHVSEFMEDILQGIDDALMQITEKKIASVQVVIDAVLDQRSLQQSWVEFTSAVSLSGLTSNIAKKSTQDLRAISDNVLNDTYKREATYGTYLLKEQKKQEKTLAARSAMYNAADVQKEAIAQRQKNSVVEEQAQKALETAKKKENSAEQKANDANAKYKAAKETYNLDKTGKNKAVMEKAKKERDNAEKNYKKSLESTEKAQNNLIKASNAVTEATYKENEAKKANTAATEEYQKLINTSDFGIDQKELRSQMQNALNDLQEQGKTLAENLQTQLGYLDEQINQTTESFNKLNEQIGYMIDSNKTIMDLATKYYGTLSEEGSKRREELAKANVDLAKAQLQGKIEYRDKTLPNERNILEEKITKAGEERDAAEYILRTLGLDPNEDLKTNTDNKVAYDKLTKEFQQQADQQKLFYDQANNKLDHYNDDMKKLAQEEIQVNKDIIDATNNAVTAITESNDATLDTIFTKMTRFVNTGSNGYIDSDLAKAQWDWQKDRNSNYLDDINSAYEIQKLEYNVQKKIDKINNPAKQKEINNLLQKRIQLLREQDKLSEYELKRVEKEFNLELAKIALEESQNNKSTLRLRRDSQGNYSYQYTSDEDDIADKKQAVADAAIDLYNWDKNQDIKITDKIISLREQQVADMKEAVNNVIEKYGIGSLSDENSEGYKILSARLTFIQDKYKELFGDLARESKEAKDNLTKTETAGMEGSGKLAESYLNGFVTFTTEGMRTWNDTQYDMVTTILDSYDKTTTEAINSILATAQTSATSFNDTINLTGQSASGFFSEMNAEVQNIMDLLVGNGENTDGTLAGAFTQLTMDATKGLITISKNIDTVTDAFKAWTTDTFPIIDQLKQKLSELNDEILKAKEAAGITDNQSRTQNMTNPIEMKEESTGKTYVVDAPALSLATTNTGAVDAIKLATTNTPTVFQKLETTLKDKKTTKNKNTKTNASAKKTTTTAKKKKKATKLDTGGYTGDWNSDEGRIAILHEKELVLNQKDTENILAAVQYMRDSILLNAMQSRMSGMSSSGAAAPTQNIQITANFPNASNHSEIETAFNNLLNRANQYMGRKF